MIGWIGLSLLSLAYITLVTKWGKLFIPINAVASLVLTIHAFLINDRKSSNDSPGRGRAREGERSKN